MSVQRLVLLSAVLLAAGPAALAAQVAVEPAPLDPRLAVPLTPPAAPRPQQAPAVRPPSAAVERTIKQNRALANDRTASVEIRQIAERLAESLEELSDPAVEAAARADGPPAAGRTPLTAGWVESTVLPEVAAFVASRARTEALASASEQLRTRMCPEQGTAKVDPRKVLVATCALSLNSNPYETPVAWTTYKAAFEEDISRLPERFLQEFTCAADACPEAARVRTLALTGLRVMRRMERGQDPILLMGNLANPSDACPAAGPGPDYCQSLRSLGLGVHALQDLLAAVSRDTAALTRELQSPTFFPNVVARLEGELKKADPALGTDASRTLRLTEGVRRLAVRLTELQRIGQELPKSTTQAELFSRYTGTALQIFGLLPDLRPRDWSDDQTKQFDAALQRMDEVAETVEQIRAKRYATAFVQITAMAARMQADKHMADSLPPWFHRYGPFVAEVASAQSSEAFQSALQAAAAPMGSYRRKRARGLSVAVNAYLGFQGGREELRDLRSEISDDAAGHFGLSMPIGLEASVGIGSASLGLFGSAVDLGNLANFRTSETDDAEGEISGEPEVSLSSVISPGVYAVLGVSKRFPLTLGAGFSWPLDVRSVRYADGDEGQASASRFSLFLGIDVPLLRF